MGNSSSNNSQRNTRDVDLRASTVGKLGKESGNDVNHGSEVRSGSNGIPEFHHQHSFVRNRKEVASMRSSKYPGASITPMPQTDELEKRFTKVLASMDLPPDKAKLLKQYDENRKWEIVCDQELVQVRDPPRFYLKKLQTYLDPKASRSFKKRKVVGDSTSTQVLKDLEISLRTNNIEWVREFLNEENRGLEVLVEYLSFRLVMMRHEEKSCGSEKGSDNGHLNVGHLSNGNGGVGNGSMKELGKSGGSPATLNKRTSRHISKLNMGDAKDDIHVCILCLRAIMNNKHGLNMVIEKQESINAIALSLKHKSLRTKALVLELLAAICLVQGGHAIILKAFDNFKEACTENHRFETLVDHFMHYEHFHVEFMVACMQFINIVVHSVDDMNERVYLQYEFSQLGIDQYLDKLKNTPSEELRIQISAYLDNVFDVGALMEDSETKSEALAQVSELKEENSQLKEINLSLKESNVRLENENLSRMVEMEQRLKEVIAERDVLLTHQKEIHEEVTTLRRAMTQKEEMMERLSRNLGNSPIFEPDSTSSSSTPSAAPLFQPVSLANLPPPPAPPPPPPPGPLMGPPPPPMLSSSPGQKGSMTIKRALTPKCKLPTLNWTVLKPREVKGTVFNQLDDSKHYNTIDFDQFERLFKIVSARDGSSSTNDDTDGEGSLQSFPSKRFKKPEALTLLEHTRLRNIAISRRKLCLGIEQVVRAINTIDLTVLKVENVEVLQRMVPTEQESKLYRDYLAERKNPELLTDEDKFLLQLSRVERISTKLAVMAYIANFSEGANSIQPQIHSVIMASRSVRTSDKFHKVLEIILAFGNYMNGAKRGPAYGFKIQSLECLTDTKSMDKRQSLMHYIVETIQSRFPALGGFINEIQFVEKASQVALENVLSDLVDLEKGMELTKKESKFLEMKHEPNSVMRDFLASSEDRLNKIKIECKTAEKDFGDCIEFFGEERQQTGTTGFFSAILKFVRAYKTAEAENEQKKRLTLKNVSPPENETSKVPPKKQQEALINELKRRQNVDVGNKKLQEVYHGALEDILSDLKNEPYRRADALRRSQRRKERLSRNFDDIEV